jgi:hypothetical protein
MPDVDSATLDALRHVSTAKLTTQLFKRALRNMFVQESTRQVASAPAAQSDETPRVAMSAALQPFFGPIP